MEELSMNNHPRQITLGTLVHMAKDRGWSEAAAAAAPGDAAAEGNREPTQREKLISIGLDAELWHDRDGNSFASVTIGGHLESYAINSRAFRNWLTRIYGDRHSMKIGGKTCPSAPSTQSLTEALNALSAKASSGAEYQPAVRVGESGGLIYLDPGTPDWSAVEISAAGWRVITAAPVRFVRPAGLRPLPVPIAGGHISELRNFLNVGTDADFVLIVSWLIASLRPNGPYPVLIINGEHGAGKSIACRVVRRLIDPNGAELRAEPRDERDLMLAAKNGWIVALDNLSYVRNDLSDAICRIATKGAFATRSLYTNDEEFLLEVCRPVLLNGIPPLASRADLTDRAVVIVLPTMAEKKRRTEDEFWSAFAVAAPRLLGVLLDGLSGALRLYPSVELKQSYRMLDFARWSEAACRALGAAPGTFEAAYRQNRARATDDAVDADPIAGAVINLVDSTGGFSGTATALLAALEVNNLPASRDRRWPKDATRLSSHLRRLPPLLRTRGIEIVFDERTTDPRRDRLIVIKRVGQK
jgi:putative DNA primase/helicase